MMRSLYSAVSGLRNHQTRMDVIANNIANVNTVGYKTSRVVFQDIFSQTSRSASGSTGTIGGTNPIQIGLGITLSAIDVIQTESAFARTDRPLDFMISGEGFFIIQTPTETLYTRAGNFYIDDDNYLVNSSGYYVMGYEEVNMADIDTDTALAKIKLSWDDGGTEKRYMNIGIDKNGQITGKRIEVDNSDPTNIVVTETIETIGFLSLATFNNTSGLEKAGESLYRESNNSGTATYSLPNTEGAGKLMGGGLEMSNVDLANEFTDMIITQRGFQANSRSITVSDTMLEELINLKR
jgi:flagellar hook protein FlgE